LQTFEDSEMQGKVKVFATIYAYCQARFWRTVSPRFKIRFEAYYRDAFSQVYSLPTVDVKQERTCLCGVL
jgi:hypothetical protein